ncbi:hypothetical protein GQ54DRAFT_12056 [Martensiomyces pterosporus]|nr:hypothetical protein GQ54DRAFT_12056 [Martensiomyces pterosporus]
MALANFEELVAIHFFSPPSSPFTQHSSFITYDHSSNTLTRYLPCPPLTSACSHHILTYSQPHLTPEYPILAMKFLNIIAIFLFFITMSLTLAAPLPAPSAHGLVVKRDTTAVKSTTHVPSDAQSRLARRDGPVLPLPAAGETLFSYLDRLLSGLPLVGKLLAGLGYVRPK